MILALGITCDLGLEVTVVGAVLSGAAHLKLVSGAVQLCSKDVVLVAILLATG